MTGEHSRRAFVMHVFLGEVEHQSDIAHVAAARLAVCGDRFDALETWSAVQSVLIAAANVSKILWPSRAAYAPRGEALRALLMHTREIRCQIVPSEITSSTTTSASKSGSFPPHRRFMSTRLSVSPQASYVTSLRTLFDPMTR